MPNAPFRSLSDFRVVLPEHVVSRLVDGMTVLLDIDSGRTFSLDDIGTQAWQALLGAPSAQAALDELCQAYEAAPGVLERDLSRLIDRLSSENLIRLEVHPR